MTKLNSCHRIFNMMILYCCLYLIAVTETVLSFSPTSQTSHHNALSLRSSLNVFAIPAVVSDVDTENTNLPIADDVINDVSNESDVDSSIPRGYHNAR
jgi:hypothetical protein